LEITFYKYQATGNDFILIDNRTSKLTLSQKQITRLCDRKFGVGADGLMLIEHHPILDFELVYYNSDGSQSLCGNGSRAAVHFASLLGIVNGATSFQAYDGEHAAQILQEGIVRVKMNDVQEVKSLDQSIFINTGSPHVIQFVDDVDSFPVFEEGQKIRYSDPFKPGGTNVNFVQILAENKLYVRTYERGVENETLSCGTGVTAAALAASTRGLTSPIEIKTKGGTLSIEFKSGQSGLPADKAGTFTDIYLVGPAKMVFKGTLEL
jgi:diaminopimelate epimerase